MDYSPKSITSQKNNNDINTSNKFSSLYNPINITDNNIPEYLNLYPSIVENNYSLLENVPFIQWDFNENKNKKRNENKKNSIFKDYSSFQEESIKNDNTIYEMNEEFFEAILQRKTHFDKNKIINTLCNFIRNSKLLQKLENEYTSEKKMDIENLVLNCAKSLGYIKLEKGEVLFKIGDVGDKFYFILNGKINILKLREIKDVIMTNVEYLKYCIFLYDNKEEYILNEVFKRNRKLIDITNIEDIIKIYRIVFINLLRKNITNHIITTNSQLFNFFKEYNQSLLSFHLSENDLINLDSIPSKKLDWENYILKRVKLSLKESIFYEDYEDLFKTQNLKYNITCYIYEPFLFFGPGLFFGDFALDSENARRNATIRAEEKTYLAWMKSVDYANIIAPRRKIEKHNEIMFLYKNYFFKNTNLFTFEKKYFHLFPPREYIKTEKILIQKNKNKNGRCLFFIKTGMIQMSINISIFELHNLINIIYEKMVKHAFFKKICKFKGTNFLINENTLKNLKKYLREPFLLSIKDKKSRLMSELNKKINYKFTIITQNELLGIEEIFLNLNNICSAEVISDKVMCYELTEKQLNIFLGEEKNLVILYTKYAINKITTLLDRLQNLKKNRIYIMKSKYENEIINNNKNYFNELNNDNEKQSVNNNENENDNNDNKKIIYNDDTYILSDNNNSISNNKKIKEIKKYKKDYYLEEENKVPKSSRLEFGNQSPLSKKAKLNIKKIFHEKLTQRINNNGKKDKFILSMIKSKEIINEKKILKKKKLSFFKDLNNNNGNKNKNSSNQNIYRYYIPENTNKDENNYLIGNTQIPLNQIKQEIKDYNSLNFNNINNNVNINSDNYSQIFELSQLKYPLSERCLLVKNNLLESLEKNNNIKKINISQSQKFYGKIKKIKKRNTSNNTINNSINIINLSQGQLIKNNKKKIIKTKQLLPSIIKDFDTNMKKKFLLCNNKINPETKKENNNNTINTSNIIINNSSRSFEKKIYENIKIKNNFELNNILTKIGNNKKYKYKAII